VVFGAVFSPVVAYLPYLRADAAPLRCSIFHFVLSGSYRFCCEKKSRGEDEREEETTFYSHVPAIVSSLFV
jgi:hypothetical protein